ncbi:MULTISPECIES: lytic transglycosylase domain-containing protein [unclassified Paenibacillus]|uniref:lytic transglycosylase domain-containing protein n=1 Tax=unclassified Paenibacillus TaxID=185978 RepID=UPI002404A6A9|nr:MULTISPECIES: lytic transglycosylase domain-containing protein [unclassified Paenibacillus]MDF9843247.1 soluble lytic murein transglycosylase-like protein [Paenibacillus sp. PastF-2]MDF9849835.1 soluble lytic murein transglycosylase-like protein [Paenibacillus sp. PastM-2]MDF9856542.1 soluble lytic murein transglycosylase-like protein [Paenibacillus sp. PastF-1]MDH6481812.1 soluble lytic murein transglycosylase-like protein [Paenibacillus sp. PastH-2]MDH6509099.1 soluble lytic murein transg
MSIDPASASGLGQLKWVNLRSSSGLPAGTGAAEAQSSSRAEFAAVLQQLSAQPADESSLTGVATLADSTAMSSLIWQQLGAANVGYGSIAGGTLESVPTDYEELIQTASVKYGVPVDLIKAVIDTESSFNPNVVSSAGAKGLMQLMDGTASGLGVSDPFDPAQNIDGGVRYLSYQLKRYDGEEKMALAAYNAGPGRVNKLGVSNDEELMQKLSLLPKETQAYITKIERARAEYTL